MMNQDPVSGNAIPPGATAAEVRDDVPINASEGEFIVPADVVRYLGLEKLEGMINKAKESISALAEGGRIGGAPPKEPMPQEAPVAPDPSMTPPPGMPMGMARGGVVTPQRRGMAAGGIVSQVSAGATVVPYINAEGRLLFIPHVDGQPVSAIPQGFFPKGAAQTPSESQNQSGRSSEGRHSEPRNTGPQTTYSQGPDVWTADDMITYGSQLNNGVQSAVDMFINRIPVFGNIISQGRTDEINNTLPAKLDQMIETGLDTGGQPLTEDQLAGLNETKDAMMTQVANETGQPPNPFQSITGFLGDIFGLTRPSSGSTSTTKTIGDKSVTTTQVASKVGGEGRTSTPNPTPNSFTPSSGTPSTKKPEGYTPVGSGNKQPQYAEGGLISPYGMPSRSVGVPAAIKPAGFTPRPAAPSEGISPFGMPTARAAPQTTKEASPQPVEGSPYRSPVQTTSASPYGIPTTPSPQGTGISPFGMPTSQPSIKTGGKLPSYRAGGFIKKNRNYQDGGMISATEDAEGNWSLPPIGAKPSGRADQPRGLLARDLGRAAAQEGRFNPQSTVSHASFTGDRGESEDVVQHLEESFSSVLRNSSGNPNVTREGLRALLDALRSMNRRDDESGRKGLVYDWNEEDIEAILQRVGS